MTTNQSTTTPRNDLNGLVASVRSIGIAVYNAYKGHSRKRLSVPASQSCGPRDCDAGTDRLRS